MIYSLVLVIKVTMSSHVIDGKLRTLQLQLFFRRSHLLSFHGARNIFFTFFFEYMLPLVQYYGLDCV
jgi:hypothetical protein